MRVVIACIIVIISVAAALGIAQTQNVFSSFGSRPEPVAAAAKPPAALPPVRVASSSPVQTVATGKPGRSCQHGHCSPRSCRCAAVTRCRRHAAGSGRRSTVPQMMAQASAAPPSAAAVPACPGNPNALGTTRTVEIDTTGGPGFGFEHFKQHDFLKPGEVVLTFDDGPWIHNTPTVLAALANHCVKAIFFPIGKHATYYPDILKQVAAGGHTDRLAYLVASKPEQEGHVDRGRQDPKLKWASAPCGWPSVLQRRRSSGFQRSSIRRSL